MKDFEDKLIQYGYEHSKKLLVLDYLYIDWLINYCRQNNKPVDSLVTSSLKTSNFGSLDHNKYICRLRLLQFLSFSRCYFIQSKGYLLTKILCQIFSS